MFDVSWTGIVFVSGLGLAMIGRKDLPRAAHVAGTQLGRIVGLLQGARARADQFGAHSELRQLQNELRSGLRELDAVRSELAVSMSAGGLMGRSLGATTPNARRGTPLQAIADGFAAAQQSSDEISAMSRFSSDSTDDFSSYIPINYEHEAQSTVYQTTSAVAEQEWATQGIAFSSAAEQGVGVPSNFNRDQAGSFILSKLLQESLVFDHYDRVVAEQDAVLQSKVASIEAKHAERSR